MRLHKVLFLLVAASAASAATPVDVIIEHGVKATMRDGVVLRADIYRPKEEGRYPVFLPDAELETIAVTTAAQRRGVARRLFSHAAVQISLLGATKVTLEVRQSNYSAIALYCALGFGNVGKRPRYYADPVEDALLMRLKL